MVGGLHHSGQTTNPFNHHLPRRTWVTHSAWGLRKLCSTLKWQNLCILNFEPAFSPLSSTFALKIRTEKKQEWFK